MNTVCGYCGYLRVSITQSGKSVVVYFSFRDKTIPANTRNTRNYSTCDLLRRYITPTTKRKRVVYYKNCRSAQSVCQVHRRSALSVRTVGLPRPSSVCTVGLHCRSAKAIVGLHCRRDLATPTAADHQSPDAPKKVGCPL